MDAPADPTSTASYRAARLAVIVLSALIILALIGLVAGMVMKLSGHARGGASADSGVFTLPQGARIVTTETQPGRLILHVRAADGDEIDIVDLDDGHLIARIRSKP